MQGGESATSGNLAQPANRVASVPPFLPLSKLTMPKLHCLKSFTLDNCIIVIGIHMRFFMRP
jgi:hypothetical protein